MKNKPYNLYTLKNEFIKKVHIVPPGFTGIVRFKSISGTGECWYLEGKFHREIGPACDWEKNVKEWHNHGSLHRLHGPAREFYNINDNEEYWIYGKRYDKQEHKFLSDIFKLKGL